MLASIDRGEASRVQGVDDKDDQRVFGEAAKVLLVQQKDILLIF